jgi:aldehyde dehydrogenase (NAD+)
MAAAAASLKRVFLELGGKSANILLDDADFSQALYGGLAVCYHAGQGCSIATRMLVPRTRLEEAVATLKTIFESLPYGDPGSREQILGPVISQAQRERVLGYVDIGRREGARLVTGAVSRRGCRAASMSNRHYLPASRTACASRRRRSSVPCSQ